MSGGGQTHTHGAPEPVGAAVSTAGAAGAPPAGRGREGQTFAGDSLVSRYASFVKLPHTLFALPFAGVGAVLASYTHAERITTAALFWIVLAFTAARFAAMGFNRIVDGSYDAINPRTRQRELPSGRLTPVQATVAVVIASAVFVLAAWRLNPVCGWLAPAALAWVFFYSYTKRFTAWAHAVLGFGLAIAPVGAYLAITGAWSQPWWALLVLAAGVTFWVAGFDVIYAIQDLSFDRANGLHSIPARLGLTRALGVARLFHGLSVLGFLALWLLGLFPIGWLYLGGVAVMAILLHHEHALVRGQSVDRLDLVRIDRAFFRVNVGVSVSVLVFSLLDRLVLG